VSLLAIVLAAAAVQWALWRRTRAVVARTCHEVRNPLCGALLVLEGVPGARAAAAAVEVRRATLALDDLGGRRRTVALAAASHTVAVDAPEVVDVAALAQAAAPAWEAVAWRHGAGFALEASGGAGAAVRADGRRLAQALGNLVANAAEHGGGLVRVAVSAQSGRVRVEVADEGPGLPAPVAVLVRRGRRRRDARGHGLAVASAALSACGGRLSAAPAARGARLVAELPAVEAVPGRWAA
jgi:signal transduction histidine kinase